MPVVGMSKVGFWWEMDLSLYHHIQISSCFPLILLPVGYPESNQVTNKQIHSYPNSFTHSVLAVYWCKSPCV